MENVTKEQVLAAVDVMLAVAEVVRVKREIPKGELYAHVMAHLSLESLEKVLGTLKGAGLVEERGFLLRWTGPSLA